MARDFDRVERARHLVAIRSIIRCKLCTAKVGQVADVYVDRGDGSALHPHFGMVIEIFVYASARVEEIKAAREDPRGFASPAEREAWFPYDDLVVVFPEAPGIDSEDVEVHCTRCGPRKLSVDLARTRALTARNRESSPAVIHI